jgi:hypothetical protein
MHDLDRIQTEFELPDEEFDTDADDLEFDLESGVAHGATNEAIFNEADEVELASELLDVSREHELDQFLGNWIRKFGRKAQGALAEGTEQALDRILKGAITKILPSAAGIAGNLLAPGVGGILGPKAASIAGSLLGLELEGLSPEDQEFEAARQVVRFGTAAMENALDSPAGESPQDVAMKALSAAAARYAPGLLSRSKGGAVSDKRTSGVWHRVGSRVILEGL